MTFQQQPSLGFDCISNSITSSSKQSPRSYSKMWSSMKLLSLEMHTNTTTVWENLAFMALMLHHLTVFTVLRVQWVVMSAFQYLAQITIQLTLFHYSNGFPSAMSANFFSTTISVFIFSNAIDCSWIHQTGFDKKETKIVIFNLNTLYQRLK